MSRSRSSLFTATAVALVVLIILVVVVLNRRSVFTPTEDLETETLLIEPAPTRPVPKELAEKWREIGARRDQGDFLGAADSYLVLITRLAGLWGDGHRDLAPYYYNFAFCLQMAGSVHDCEGVLEEARAMWPRNLRLQVLDVSLRSAVALQTGKSDADLESLYDNILQRSRHPYLRGLGMPPESMYTQWSAVLLEAREYRSALDRVDRALALAPDYVPARKIKSRVLLSMQRSAEARAILEPLLGQGEDMELEYYLGVALFDEGRAKDAHARLAPILASVEEQTGVVDETLLANLRVYTARSLIDLGRKSEAIETLLPGFVVDPFDVEMLGVLVEAAPTGSASAIARRRTELSAHASFERGANIALAKGDKAGALFFKGLSSLVTGRLAAAFDELRRAVGESPTSIETHRAYGETLESLGRLSRAEANCDEAFEKTGAPSFLLEKARIVALRGRTDDARKLLARFRLAPLSRPANEEEETEAARALARRVGARLRVYLELHDVEALRMFFRENRAHETSEPNVAFARAEQLVLERRPRQVRAILARRTPRRPHLATWRRVLLKIVELELEGDAAEATFGDGDPSDLFDLPRFITQPAYLQKSSSLSPKLAGEIERLRALFTRRAQLIEAIDGAIDSVIDNAVEESDGVDISALWLELFGFYVDCGAKRKAKEIAWYLLDNHLENVDGFVRLAEALARPEDVVERLSVAERGLLLDPKRERLIELRAEARGALGLATR